MHPGRIVAALSMVAGLSACSDSIAQTPLPDGVSVHLDQSGIQRQGREVFLRVENDTRHDITIERFVLTSPRLEDVTWSGAEEIGSTYETDLEFTMPVGRCGADIDATVRFTYRVDGGDLQESTTTADDPYGNAAASADRDCAEITLEDAADVVVGEPTVSGTGRASVLHLPVTMTPTGDRSDVRFGGFGSTVLFRQTADSPADVDVPLGPGDPPARLDMQVVPARCDPHALAEDKVGRLFPVTVLADDVGTDASYFLPLTRDQKLAFFDFFRSSCGLE